MLGPASLPFFNFGCKLFLPDDVELDFIQAILTQLPAEPDGPERFALFPDLPQDVDIMRSKDHAVDGMVNIPMSGGALFSRITHCLASLPSDRWSPSHTCPRVIVPSDHCHE